MEPDGIGNDVIKVLSEALPKLLTHLFNYILSEGIVSELWVISEIIFPHKKGIAANYKPISLSLNICKILIKIIKERVYRILETWQPCE